MMNYHIDVNSFGFKFLNWTKIYNFQPAVKKRYTPEKLAYPLENAGWKMKLPFDMIPF